MKAVIAEKPSVGREIATFLGATDKKEGYLEGNGYVVTWALGHLVSLCMPEDYGILGFQKSSLPILPNPFLLTSRKTKNGNTYEYDERAIKQLKVIRKLLDLCDSIVVATDAGREGELIFRYIYEFLGCQKPFERLWISSLTERAIRKGFENLLPGGNFDGLFHAGKARSRADWLVGINASQALSIASGGGVYSLGRVQTPTLALVCKRYFDNKNFEVRKYWQIRLEHKKDFIEFKSLSQDKWADKKLVEKSFKSVQKSEVISITAIDSKTVTEQPPLLFDLTGLQKDANKKLGMSAEETLGICQSLYEKKFITYPRTGSKYIPEDQWEEIPSLIRALEDRPTCKAAAGKVTWGRFNRRIVNDLKVTDHHGLLITGKIPSALTAKEDVIYDMVALRLLEAILYPCSKEVTDVKLEVQQFAFALKGCKIIDPGWRAIKSIFSEEGSETIQDLPELAIGDELKFKNPSVIEKKTKPPVLFTEATLLSAMETAGRHVDDNQQRQVRNGIGLGTPATRAAIIETLIKRKYIQREKKSVIPTLKGLRVYDLVKSKKIADVTMTAEWEFTLQKIENGQVDSASFQKEMERFTASITQEILDSSFIMADLPELICPKCQKQQLNIRDAIVKCPDPICNWIQFRNICGVQLSIAEIEKLINEGRTSLIHGMKSKSGKKFDGYIVRAANGNTHFEFDTKR